MRLFSHPYRYIFIALLAVYSYGNTLFVEAFRFYGIKGNHWLLLLGFFLVCWMIWEGSRIAEKLIANNKGKSKVHPALQLFIISMPLAFVTGSIVFYFVAVILLGNDAGFSGILFRLCILFALRVNLFLQCINAVLFFIDSYKQKQLEAEELRRISTQAQLREIQSQINPHFLFNNLNVLSTLVLQKHADANRFIEAFSSVYRYILKNRETELVALQSELEFIDPYIYLLKTRFGNSLQVDIDIPVQYHNRYIVPAALQLLVENAIKHNIASVAQPLSVSIVVDKDEYLVVSNNLQEKLEKPQSTEFGLNNINQRFRLLSGKEIKISNNGQAFVVAIPLLKG